MPSDNPPASVLRWLKQNVIPMKTVEAGNGFDDLLPLKEIVGDARIVSLGEATHGTREFFQMKHRMLEFLASEMGFDTFGIEANMPECFALNRFVLGESDDPSPAHMRFWTWDTKEVLDMLRWMRRFNRDPARARKLSFYGFDMQFPTLGALEVLDYLGEVDPNLARTASRVLAALSDDFSAFQYPHLSKRVQESTRSGIASLFAALRRERYGYVSRSDALRWRGALLNLTVVKQAEEKLRSNSGNVRDKYMAANVAAILDLKGPDSKAVLWAHNGHVSRQVVTGRGGSFRPMGSHLDRKFGKKQVIFGFAFGHGSFQAIDMDRGGLRRFTVPPLPKDTLDALLSKVGPGFVLDLRKLTGEVRRYFHSEPRTRSTGAIWSQKKSDQFVYPSRLLNQYDALIFVGSTTAARRLQTGTRGVTRRDAELGVAPKSFERGRLGGVPAGWNASPRRSRGGYAVALRSRGHRTGRRSVLIAREESPWRWGEGRLTQTFSAERFRGRRVTFSVWIRVEVADPRCAAHLLVQAELPRDPERWWPAPPVTLATTAGRPVRAPKWERHAVSAYIPKKADRITIGLVLAGSGEAFFSGMSFKASRPGAGRRARG